MFFKILVNDKITLEDILPNSDIISDEMDEQLYECIFMEPLRLFKIGFHEIIPEIYLKHYTWQILRAITVREPKIVALEIWKKYTEVVVINNKENDLSQKNNLNWFLDYINNLTPKNHLRLIEFICGTDILPIGDFVTLKILSMPVTIKMMPNKNDLLRAITSENTLELPIYDTEATLCMNFDTILSKFKGTNVC